MRFSYVFLLIFVLNFWRSATLADPGEGFGIFIDVGQQKPVNDDTGKEYQTSKIFGDQIDYQFPLGKSFSFSLFGSENVGKGALPENKRFKNYKTAIIGAELRAWMGPLFLGVHRGKYFLTWIETISSYSGIKSSSGKGLGLGLEGESGWSLGWYKEKSEKIKFENLPDQRFEGDRIIIGYRWR